MSSSEDHLARSLRFLVKFVAKRQALKTAWQTHLVQGLVECISKCHARKTLLKVDSFQVLVKLKAKRNAVKTTWQVDSFKRQGVHLESRLLPETGRMNLHTSNSEDHVAGSLRPASG